MDSNGNKDLMTGEGHHPLSDFELQTDGHFMIYATLHSLSVLEF
jgi:hypothetical protein